MGIDRSPCKSGKEYWVNARLGHNPMRIDFPEVCMHEKGMCLSTTNRLLLLACILFCCSCMHLPRPSVNSPVQQSNKVSLAWLSSPFALLHPFASPPLPPKAVALLTVGTVRTISNDGTYVIAELEPGVMVATGNSLLVTANGMETARLNVAEITPPYFVADIEHGHPEPHDLLRK